MTRRWAKPRWIVEKFCAWSDCEGNVERRFSKDELLTNIMIYWVTQTINSSFGYYRDMNTPKLQPGQHIEVPAGFARFPKDIPGIDPPRELAERHLRIARWTQMPRGGHFAALEEPALLAEDMRAFFHDLKEKTILGTGGPVESLASKTSISWA